MDLPADSPGFTVVTATAVDPNPDGVRSDVVYFNLSTMGQDDRIRKVAADCSAVLDGNYGNLTQVFTFNMAVDPENGDLYLANATEIRRITPSESVELVKGGFASIRSIAVAREGANDPGILLVADGTVVQALPLDNISASPITIATVASLDAAGFGAQVSGGPWIASNVNRTVVVYSDGSTFLEPHPLVEVSLRGPFQVRISSPTPSEQLPTGQSKMRPSTFGDTTFSHAVAKLQYRDGLSRPTCALVGDPGPGAPQYDPSPAVPSNCHKPRASASAICDNFDDIVASGAGSFVDGGGLSSCKTCGSLQNPCSWEFRITNRYGGDNYKVYFASDASAVQYAATSDVYTAWKHVHFERERMCNVGGLLFRDYGATNHCGGVGQPACCGAPQPPCDELRVYYADGTTGVSNGQSIVVFDELNRYAAGETRTVMGMPTNNGDGSISVKLNMPLDGSYWASSEHSPGVPPHVPDFVNLHSGGVCVPASGFVGADVSDLRQAFDHALVDYHIPTYGVEGSEVVPRLWPAFFDFNPTVGRPCASRRFSRIWYNRFVDTGDVGCPDLPNVDAAEENNVLHVIPAFDTTDAINPAGFSGFEGAFSYVFDTQIAQDCAASSGGCTGTEPVSMRRRTVAHETAHNFRVNWCSAGGHDTRKAWCGAPGGTCVAPSASDQSCVMVGGISTPELDMRADGIDHFCKEDLALGDPNPSCSGTPREGAIRTWEDPQ